MTAGRRAPPGVRAVMDACRRFDGRDVGPLRACAADLRPDTDVLDALVAGASQPDEDGQVAATWILKDLLERGRAGLDERAVAALARGLDRVTADMAVLHLCQSLRFLDVPRRHAGQVLRLLRRARESEVKFVRAWACDGFHRLALQHPEHAEESRFVLEQALADPAASVRARARNVAREVRP